MLCSSNCRRFLKELSCFRKMFLRGGKELCIVGLISKFIDQIEVGEDEMFRLLFFRNIIVYFSAHERMFLKNKKNVLVIKHPFS